MRLNSESFSAQWVGLYPGEGILIYCSVWGHAVKQDVILVKVSDTTRSIFDIFIAKHRCRPLAFRKCDLIRDGSISTFSDRFLAQFLGRAQFHPK